MTPRRRTDAGQRRRSATATVSRDTPACRSHEALDEPSSAARRDARAAHRARVPVPDGVVITCAAFDRFLDRPSGLRSADRRRDRSPRRQQPTRPRCSRGRRDPRARAGRRRCPPNSRRSVDARPFVACGRPARVRSSGVGEDGDERVVRRPARFDPHVDEARGSGRRPRVLGVVLVRARARLSASRTARDRGHGASSSSADRLRDLRRPVHAGTRDRHRRRSVHVVEYVRRARRSAGRRRDRSRSRLSSRTSLTVTDDTPTPEQLTRGACSTSRCSPARRHGARASSSASAAPQDIEWADRRRRHVWIVQARPITTLRATRRLCRPSSGGTPTSTRTFRSRSRRCSTRSLGRLLPLLPQPRPARSACRPAGSPRWSSRCARSSASTARGCTTT